MDELPAPHTGVRPSPGMCSIKPPENCPEQLLVNCLWSLHEFIINKSPTVKESENHHLCSGNGSPWSLRARFPPPQPLHAVHPLVWIPHIDPRFVHGNCIDENPWIEVFQACEEVANVNSPLLVIVSENSRHKGGASLLELEILPENSLNGGTADSRSQGQFFDGNPAVLGDQGLNLPDISKAMPTLGLGTPRFVHNAVSSSPELPYPLVNAGVTQDWTRGITCLKGSLDLIKCPAHFHTEMDIYPLL